MSRTLWCSQGGGYFLMSEASLYGRGGVLSDVLGAPMQPSAPPSTLIPSTLRWSWEGGGWGGGVADALSSPMHSPPTPPSIRSVFREALPLSTSQPSDLPWNTKPKRGVWPGVAVGSLVVAAAKPLTLNP